MKLLILLTIFVFVFSNYIIMETREKFNCAGKIEKGIIIVADKCMKKQKALFETQLPYTYREKFSCDPECKRCPLDSERPFGCIRTNNNHVYYGLPSKLNSTGFYFNRYKNSEDCSRNEENLYTEYYVQTTCVFPANRMNRSQRIGYVRERKGVLIEEFEKYNCTGTMTNVYFLPLDACSKNPNEESEFLKIKLKY